MTESRPSKAAMELAWKVMACTNEVTIGVLIDLALADLLEKAQAVATACGAEYDEDRMELKEALEPWKDGK